MSFMGSVARRVGLVAVGIVIGLLIGAGASSALRATLGDLFGPSLVRGQFVIFKNGQDDVVSFDRGRIISVSTTEVVLRERDGTVQVIPVDASTKITLAGRGVGIVAVRRGMKGEAYRSNGGTAYRLDVTLR
jgi:hypothetical protein